MQQKSLYVTIFFSGIVSLAIEMCASRLLGNVFGTSNLVWASIIGLILVYLAAGYFLGGRWADRSPSYRTFYTILLWAGFFTGLVPIFSRPVLRLAANAFDQLEMGILFGSFTGVLILLCIPVTLLGTTSPFAIRLALQNDNSHAGKISGQIYAISTLGSFIGTFLPVLILIPLIGTYRTFLTLSLMLISVALIGLWLNFHWKVAAPYLLMVAFIAALWIWGLPGTDKATSGQIYETESSYNYIQVLEKDGYHQLRLNEGQGVHSIYHPTIINYTGPCEQVLVAPFFNTPPYDPARIKNIAIVGLAAGTTARQASLVYPQSAIDGFEIDPKIVEVGRKYFDMNQPNLNVIVQDGRWGLAHSTRRYEIISIDAYRPPYIPSHLTTQEFFQIVRDHLTEDGVMVINIGRSPNSRRLINTLNATIATVFPSTHVIDIPNTFNSILFATVQPTVSNNLFSNFGYLLERGDMPPLLLDSVKLAAVNLQPSPPPDQVFTDDLAPIEWITNNMILSFIAEGQVEHLE